MPPTPTKSSVDEPSDDLPRFFPERLPLPELRADDSESSSSSPPGTWIRSPQALHLMWLPAKSSLTRND
jgi:hypothetical protein